MTRENEPFLNITRKLGIHVPRPTKIFGHVSIERKMEADALRTVYGLAVQSYLGMLQIVGHISIDDLKKSISSLPSESKITRRKAKVFIKNVNDVIPITLRKESEKNEDLQNITYLGLAALSLLKVTVSAGVGEASQRFCALQALFDDRVATEIYNEYPYIFNAEYILKFKEFQEKDEQKEE